MMFHTVQGRGLSSLRGHTGESPGNTGRARSRLRSPESRPWSNELRAEGRRRSVLELLELHVLNVGQGLDSSIMQVNSSEVRSEGGGERERGGGERKPLHTPPPHLHR